MLGAGSGGLANAVELTQAGSRVHLWSRNPATVAPYATGVVPYSGLLGDGEAILELVTADLDRALEGATAAVVSLPAFLHGQLFADLAHRGWDAPVVLSPGHTGGALHLREVFQKSGGRCPPVAELSSLPYVCRAQPGEGVRVTGRARQLRCGSLPAHAEAAKLAGQLWSCELDFCDVLASSLSNVNLVLHPPVALLAAAWVEATKGGFRFYADAMTDGVGRVVDALDSERLEVAARLGHRLPPLAGEMQRLGTVDDGPCPDATKPGRPAGKSTVVTTADLVRTGQANLSIRAPSSLAHRYYKEDFAFGLAPLLALAAVAKADLPVASSLLWLGRVLVGDEMPPDLGAEALGIAGLSADDLVAMVRQ